MASGAHVAITGGQGASLHPNTPPHPSWSPAPGGTALGKRRIALPDAGPDPDHIHANPAARPLFQGCPHPAAQWVASELLSLPRGLQVQVPPTSLQRDPGKGSQDHGGAELTSPAVPDPPSQSSQQLQAASPGPRPAAGLGPRRRRRKAWSPRPGKQWRSQEPVPGL